MIPALIVVAYCVVGWLFVTWLDRLGVFDGVGVTAMERGGMVVLWPGLAFMGMIWLIGYLTVRGRDGRR